MAIAITTPYNLDVIKSEIEDIKQDYVNGLLNGFNMQLNEISSRNLSENIKSRAKKIFIESWISHNLYSNDFSKFAKLLNNSTYDPDIISTEGELRQLSDVNDLFDDLRGDELTYVGIPQPKDKTNETYVAALRDSVLSYVALASESVIALYKHGDSKAFFKGDFEAAKEKSETIKRTISKMILDYNSSNNGLIDVFGLSFSEANENYLSVQMDYNGVIRKGRSFADASKYVSLDK